MTNESIKKAFGRFWEHTVNKVSEKADIKHEHPWDEVGIETTYGDTLTWDGNTDGLECVDDFLYKISDLTPTDEILANGMTLNVEGESIPVSTEEIQECSSAFGCVTYGMMIFVITEENFSCTIDDSTLTFPETGIYVQPVVQSVTILNYNGFEKTEITPLPNKYLDFIETVGGDTLTWDGNTNGLESVMDFYYKISDVVPPINENTSYTVTFSSGKNLGTPSIPPDLIAEEGLIALGGEAVLIALNDITFDGMAFTSGIYLSAADRDYVSSLTINGYTGFTTAKLKEEYLPEHKHEHEFIETVGGDTLTWDGNTDGLECVTLDANYYKVSENVLTYEDLTGSWTVYTNNKSDVPFTNENMPCSQIDDNTLCIGDPSGLMLVIFVTTDIKEGDLSVSKGIYFRKNEGEYYPTSLTINGYNGFEKEQIKSEYISNGISAQEITAGAPANVTINSIKNNGKYNDITKMLSINVEASITTTAQVTAGADIVIGTLSDKLPDSVTALAVYFDGTTPHRFMASVDTDGKIHIRSNVLIASGLTFTLNISGMCMVA